MKNPGDAWLQISKRPNVVKEIGGNIDCNSPKLQMQSIETRKMHDCNSPKLRMQSIETRKMHDRKFKNSKISQMHLQIGWLQIVKSQNKSNIPKEDDHKSPKSQSSQLVLNPLGLVVFLVYERTDFFEQKI